MKFFLFLCCCSLTGFAQKVVVQDNQNRPIEYVNIGVKGTSKGLISDEQGGFSLEALHAKDTDSIYFGHLSYKHKVLLKKDITDKVVLEAAEIVLPEATFTAKQPKERTLKGKGLPTIATMSILAPTEEEMSEDEEKGEEELGDFISLNKDTFLTKFEMNIVANTLDRCVLRVVVYQSNKEHTLFKPLIERPIYIEVPASRKRQIFTKELSVFAPKGVIWVALQPVELKGSKDSELRIRCRANGGWTRTTIDNILEKIPLGLGIPFSVKGRQ